VACECGPTDAHTLRWASEFSQRENCYQPVGWWTPSRCGRVCLRQQASEVSLALWLASGD
jgi:hypothetical protein